MTKLHFFPWPKNSERAHLYRLVRTEANLQYARPGDVLTVIYPSGTKVRARIFHIHRDHDTGHKLVQMQAENSPVRRGQVHNSTLAASVQITHKRKKGRGK